MPIQQDLERCINDTRSYVSNGAANILIPWRDYSIEQLTASIGRAIRIPKNQANGFIIHQNGGVSLEEIVLSYDLFTEDDKRIAKQTLGM
jgi:hypothetical protein